MMDRADFAAKAAYETHLKCCLSEELVRSSTWDDLSDHDKTLWRAVARAAQAMTPAPFFITMDIKVPGQSPLGQNVCWHFFFGMTDAEIEQAGKDFVTKMKELRGG